MQTLFSPNASRLLTIVAAAGLAACGPKSDAGDGSGDDSGSATGTGTGSGADGDESGDDGAGSGSGSGGDSSGDDGASESGDGSTGSGTTGPTEPQPVGSPCTSDDECESMKCYMIPMLGGTCSECLVDADCMANGEPGTCALDAATMQAMCTDGGLGSMCMSDEACMSGLVCAQLADLMGFFPADFCSDCADDGDCTDQTCSPHYETSGGISGWLTCVDPQSVPNGDGCPVEAGGTNPDGSVCESGYCGVADVLGLGAVFLGVCGECDPATNDGCMAGETCNAPMADLGGATPAACS